MVDIVKMLTGREWAERIREWFPESPDARVRRAVGPVIEPHRAFIVDQREQGVTLATIHQRLRDEHRAGKARRAA